MPEHYVARNPQVAWRVYDGEAVILLAENSSLNTLNAVGTLIWEAADGTTPLSAVVGRICNEFDVERAQAERDAAGFIEKLRQRNLLSVWESPRSTAQEAT
jgi:coenzyme PQQ synthesis protein D (PqqD)